MEKSANFKNNLLKLVTSKGALATAAGAGAGTAGYYGGSAIGKKKGFRAGAERTATEMASAFSAANQQENQQIVNSFKNFNNRENVGIAQHYYKRGLEAGSAMNKNASIEAVYDAAFDSEIDKIAAISAFKPAIVSGLKTLKSSFKNLGSGSKDVYRQAKSMVGSTPAQRKVQKQYLKKDIKDTAKKSKAALGTIAAGATGASLYAAS